ncbi:hypothetical protein D910_12654 [Dendroctonus ponderosae]
MFGKSSVPERHSFQLDIEQITDDIESISLNEEERNKLYLSLDNQPPKNDHCAKLEDFVKRTDHLEVLKQKLDSLMDEVDKLVFKVSNKVEEIQTSINNG